VPKECEVTVESTGGEDPGWAVWKMSLFTLGEIDVTSVQDMVNKIKQKKKDDGCDCLKKLTIMGHGAPGYIEIGSESMNIWDTSTWKPIFDQLKGCFCKDAEIIFAGCSIGADKDGANFLSVIANCLGVKANAPTHTINQYWSGPGEQTAYPGQPPPEPIPEGGDQKKKKKAKGKKKCLMYMQDDKPRLLDIDQLRGFAILKKQDEPDEITLKKYFDSSKLFRNFVDSLDIYDPFDASDMPFAIDAMVYFWTEAEQVGAKPIMPTSYLVGGYRYLVAGGDWHHVYRITEGMHMKIREYGRYPDMGETIKKYPFLNARRKKATRKARARRRAGRR
jgi:hypothetical protein